MLIRPEIYGIEHVPRATQREGFWTNFVVFFNLLLNPGTLISAGMMIMQGFSIANTLFIQVLGVSIALAFIIPVGYYCARFGMPGPLFCRYVFGLPLSRFLISLGRVIISVYWFAFQSFAAGIAIIAVLLRSDIHAPQYIILLSLCLLQALIALWGFSGVKILARISAGIKFIIFPFLLYVMWQHSKTQHIIMAQPLSITWLTWAIWLNAIISSMLTGITAYPDLLRYNKKTSSLISGVLAGSLTGTFIGASFGAIAVSLNHYHSINPFSLFSHHNFSAYDSLLLLIVISLDVWAINTFNLYSGSFSFNNIFSRISRFQATLIVAIIATGLSFIPNIINAYTSYMAYFAALFAPVTGILLAHVILHAKASTITETPLNKGALLLLLIATAGIYLCTSERVVPALSISLLSAALYYLWAQQQQKSSASV